MNRKNHNRRLRTGSRYALLVLLTAAGISACSDSGVDAETAKVIIGDVKDTNALPDLQKVTLEAGFVGEESKVVTEFVNFRRLARYTVDTLDDGSVTGLRGVSMVAELADDSSTAGLRRRLSPLRLLKIHIVHLPVGLTGVGKEIDLTDDPDTAPRVGGIKAVLESGDVLMTDEEDNTSNWGAAHIVSVNERNRKIILRVKADLLNRSGQNPTPPLRRLTLNMVMELPY